MTTERQIQKQISSDRLYMELINTDDDDFIIALVNSKGWLENIGDRNIHSKKEAVAYIHKILATENFFYWVVRSKDASKPIGIISFLKRSYLDHFDVGFAFLPEFCNQGYAYEAAKAILNMVSKMPEFTVILATTLPANTNSIKLLKKLGFRFDKEMEIENEIPAANTRLHVYTNASA